MQAQTMRRTAVTATAGAVFACLLSACGASHSQQPRRPGTRAPTSAIYPTRQDEVLSLSGLGTIYVRCPRGARSWTLRFAPDRDASETVSYRVGTGTRRTVNPNPGGAIMVHLIPNATRTHEPANRFVPAGQARGLTGATSVPTTAPLQLRIYQATEPQTLRADVHLALTTIGGESGRCVLVGSTVNAYIYPNGIR